MEVMRSFLLVTVVALVFAAPAAAADVYVTNNSTLPDASLADAVPAFQQALDTDFAPVWNEASGSKLIMGDAPPGSWQIRLVDDIEECWICAGYHDMKDGVPFAVVSTLDDWELTFSHELWELLVNPYTDRTAMLKVKKKARVYALETADPVEGNDAAYTRQSSAGHAVTISDFVTPAWFRRGSKGPWDFTRNTKRPLHVLEDGYQLWLHNGFWDAIYGRAGASDAGEKARRWNAPFGAVRTDGVPRI
jgi:hypothetical protein